MPAAIAGAVVGWLSLTGAAAVVATIVVQIGVGLAMTALSRALAPDPAQPEAMGIRSEVTLEGGTIPQTLMLGRYATAGTIVAPYYAFGSAEVDDVDIDNAYRYMIVDISDYPIHALKEIWLNDDKFNIATDFNGNPMGNFVKVYLSEELQRSFIGRLLGSGSTGSVESMAIRLGYHDGRQTAASTALTSRFATHPKRPWESTAIGKGVAYALIGVRYDPDKWRGDPQVKFEVEGARLYDRRKDTTNGGSGTHREADRDTFAYTENPITMVENIMRGIVLDDGVRWGLGADWASLPASSWNTAKAACDAARTKDGLPKYRAGYEIRLGTPDHGGDEPFDVIDELLKGCSGSLVDVGGTFYVRVGPPALPIVTISDDDILVDQPQESIQFDGKNNVFNAIRAHYPNPKQQWRASEAPMRTNAAWEAEDGERLVANVTFNSVFDVTQVQQLQAEYIKDARRLRRHTLVLPPKFSGLIPQNVFTWNSERNSYTTKQFEVFESAVDPRTLSVTLSVREVDPNDYSPEDVVEPEYADDMPAYRVPIPVPGWSVSAISLSDSAGDLRRSAIKLAWSPTLTAQEILFEIRVKNTLADVPGGSIRNIAKGYHITTNGITPNETYEVRGRLVAGAWTPWTTITTTNVKLGPNDISVTPIGDGAPPAVVANVRAYASPGAFYLDWTAKTEPDLVRYEIYENANASATPTAGTVPIYIIGPTQNFTSIAGYEDSTTRTFWVRAVDSDGAGPWSAGVTESTPAKPGVTTADLQGLVEATSFASGIEPVGISTAGTLPTVKTTTALVWGGNLYRWNGTAYVKSVPTTDLAGTITTAQIADAALTTAKFASTIKPVEIVSALPGTPHVAGRTVFLTTDNKLYRNTGTGWTKETDGADIKADSITAGQIAAGAIGANEIAANAITAAQIAANTITANEIAANAITATEIAADAITTAKIAAGAVTAAEIAANTITAAQIAAGAISTDQLAARAITADKLLLTASGNMIPRWDFNDKTPLAASPDGFEIAGGTYSLSTSNLSGNRSLQIDRTNNTTSCQVYETPNHAQPCQGGQTLWLEVVVAPRTNAMTAGFYARFMFYDANRVALASPNAEVSCGIENEALTTGWNTFTGKLVIPSTARYVGVKIYHHNTDTTANLGIRIDHVHIRPANAAQLIVDGGILANMLSAGEIITGTAQIRNAIITGAKIAAATITTALIADAQITTAKIADLAVGTAEIANAAITTAKIANLAVGTAQIIDASINSAKIASLAVGSAEIADAAVTNAKIGTAAITSAKIGDLQVNTLQIAGNAVTLPVRYYNAATVAAGTAYTFAASVQIDRIVGLAVDIYFSTGMTSTAEGGIAFQLEKRTYSGGVWGAYATALSWSDRFSPTGQATLIWSDTTSSDLLTEYRVEFFGIPNSGAGGGNGGNPSCLRRYLQAIMVKK